MPDATPAKLRLKRGLLQNLSNQEIVDGTIYITTDEQGMYVDSGNTRLRIGDFITVNTLLELQTKRPISESALYYVKENNILARRDIANNRWVQINKAGIVSITNSGPTGAGSVISNIQTSTDTQTGEMSLVVTYTTVASTDDLEDLEGRVTTLETTASNLSSDMTILKGNAQTQGSIQNSIATAVNALLGAETQYTTFEAVGDRLRALNELVEDLDGFAEDLTALRSQVTTNTGNLTTLMGDSTTAGSVDYKVAQEAALRSSADSALSTRITTLEDTVNDDVVPEVAQLTTDVGILKGGANVTGSVQNTVTTEIARIVANAPADFDTLREIADWISSHATDAAAMNSDIQSLLDRVDNLEETASDVNGDLSDIKTRLATAENDIDALEVVIGVLNGAEDVVGSVKQQINSAVTAMRDLYDDLDAAITILNGDDTVVGSVDYKVAQEAALRELLEARFDTLSSTVSGHTTSIANINTSLNNLGDDIDDLDSRLTIVENDITWQEY